MGRWGDGAPSTLLELHMRQGPYRSGQRATDNVHMSIPISLSPNPSPKGQRVQR